MKLTWACHQCGSVVVSDSKEQHTMDWCECRQTAVDLEEGYMRTLGDPVTIKKEEV
ncbi:MAG: hypothetical protein GY941_22260 [Planctomycetes bacterium]|nr:hypothetical protein [Planctomycetota bacterium]